jgi:hypothetical protein
MSYKRHNDDGNTNTNRQRRRWKERNHYERHYCELCNVWLAADRQSILHHEQGAQHQTKLQQATIVKRETTVREEKEQQMLQASLQRMEAAAMASTIGQDYGRFGTAIVTAAAHRSVVSTKAPSTTTTSTSTTTTKSTTTAPASKSEWEERKRQREEEKRTAAKARAKETGRNKDDRNDNDEFIKRRKVAIGEHEGSYELDGITWLEGVTFGDLFEIDLPIQFWRGGTNCTDVELQLPGNALYWQDAIIAAVRHRPNEPQRADRIVLDVAYLEKKQQRLPQRQAQPLQDDDDDEKNNEEERIVKSVPLRHARIRLGNPADERIPETLLEARLLAMGGEEIQVVVGSSTATDDAVVPEIDQATGFSGWQTVAIKRTTVRNEQKIQRDILRQQKREAEQQAKETEARRMEQAKVANADDSALGAFDIWNRTATGYKGVDIHNAHSAVVQVQDLAKKVADGPVAFKKKKTAVAGSKKQSRRTTSADD